jgi:hypothetical protein
MILLLILLLLIILIVIILILLRSYDMILLALYFLSDSDSYFVYPCTMGKPFAYYPSYSSCYHSDFTYAIFL